MCYISSSPEFSAKIQKNGDSASETLLFFLKSEVLSPYFNISAPSEHHHYVTYEGTNIGKFLNSEDFFAEEDEYHLFLGRRVSEIECEL